MRAAAIGVAASGVSDVTSNSLRVLKTARQTTDGDDGYVEIATNIVKEEGVQGLLTRGLGTRLGVNAANAALLAVFLLRPYTWVDGTEARWML